MASREIYKIQLLNWYKHNTGHKKSYKKTLLDNNFCSDAKVRALTMTERWVLLNLVLMCGDVNRDTVEVSSKQLRDMLECNRSLRQTLDRLKSFQLVTYEIMSFALQEENRIEEKRIEQKRIVSEVEKPVSTTKEKPVKVKKSDPEQNRVVWETYRGAYFARYKVEPVRNLPINAMIAKIVSRLGVEDATSVVKFYLQHNDGLYLKTTHSFSLCLRDCESLRTQMLRGKAITSQEVRRFEKTQGTLDLITQIQNGEV